ncbi:MAG: hypothetical protein ACREJC_04685, partial [Tepidisphaeraceae bacterium]
FIIVLLASLNLDHGRMLTTSLIVALAFWIGAAIHIARFPTEPTRWTLLALKLGYVPLFAIAMTWAEFAVPR